MTRTLVGWRLAGALRAVCLAAPLATILTLAPATAEAQTATGNVRGYVTGPGNAPLGAVTVVARNHENNQQRGTQTNESGFFYLGGLRPGAYEFTARRVGLTHRRGCRQQQWRRQDE